MGVENEETMSPASEEVVTLQYADLLDKDSDISEPLVKGLGQDGLGIIAIAGIPRFPELRTRLLSLGDKLAALPDETLKKLVDPASSNFGWSCGAEVFHGQTDLSKGSFYANVCRDKCTDSEEIQQRYPSQCRDNTWPKEDLPELEPAFKEIGSLVVEVGVLLAHHCDKYTSRITGKEGVLESTLRQSQLHKGRLLHYFPAEHGEHVQKDAMSAPPNWCGWHTDFGSLTGLTAAMYTKEGIKKISCPDPQAGLYVETRNGRIVRVTYDENCLAYQIGQTAELLSGGVFHATPHSVKSPKQNGEGVARNTFALFMQPSWEYVLEIPESMQGKLKHIKKNNLTFGEYSETTLEEHKNINPRISM